MANFRIDLLHTASHWLSSLQRCELCLEPVRNGLSPFLCEDCRLQLPRIISPCIQCAEPLPDGFPHRRCLRCQQQPPVFDYCHSNFAYAAPIDHWIRQAKDHHQHSWLIRLARLMLLAPPSLLNVDGLVFIPSHKKRLLWRGYNPAAVLCYRIAAATGLPVLASEAIRRSQHTEQRQLSAVQRQHQINHSLEIDPDLDLQGRQLLLVEDVVTTGASANTMARLLKQQGARMVGVWSLARTPPHHGSINRNQA